jgi:hypothetical protein
MDVNMYNVKRQKPRGTYVRFEVFMDVKTHNMALWIMTPSILVNRYIRQRARRIPKFETVHPKFWGPLVTLNGTITQVTTI